MGTVSKALGLVGLLKDAPRPLGLSEIARLSGFDKATTRRLLLELVANGYVEQDFETRDYALGPALQMLGRVREERFPLTRVVKSAVRELADKTGETVHAAEYCAGELASIWIEESAKANRVMLGTGLKLPLHATASGYAFLAASTDSFVERACKRELANYTGSTPSDAEALHSIVRTARALGYSRSDGSYEDGVSSVAAAITDPNGKPVATIAIALPSSRMNDAVAVEFGQLAMRAAADISARLFGAPPAALHKAS